MIIIMDEKIKEFYGPHYLYMVKAMNTAIAISYTYARNAKIVSRIKNPKSMEQKIINDGFPVNYESALLKESEAIGIRIITDTISSVYSILQQLQNSRFCRIINIKDYIKEPKESGYRSLHVIVAIPSEDPDFPELKIEIQIRTAIMDCWASLEHLVKYKQITDMTPEIEDLLATYRAEAEKEFQF